LAKEHQCLLLPEVACTEVMAESVHNLCILVVIYDGSSVEAFFLAAVS